MKNDEMMYYNESVCALVNLCTQLDASYGPEMRYVLKAALDGLDPLKVCECDHDTVMRYAALTSLMMALFKGRYDLLTKFHPSVMEEFLGDEIEGVIPLLFCIYAISFLSCIDILFIEYIRQSRVRCFVSYSLKNFRFKDIQ